MREWGRNSGASLHRVRRWGKDDQTPVRDRYARLMQVEFRHAYYSSDGLPGPCPDFAVVPTPPTQGLMRSLGLQFLAEPAGFSILYNVARNRGLFWYLTQHGLPQEAVPTPHIVAEYWTRLSFVLVLKNPAFVNFTQIPIETDLTERNFYFTNQEAHPFGHREFEPRREYAILNKGDWVDGAVTIQVTGPQVRVETPEGVKEVAALDIAGKPVVVGYDTAGRPLPAIPRCIPEVGSPPDQVCRDFVYLDLTTDDQDKYTILVRKTDGSDPKEYPLLYSVPNPIPMGFIDLLFARPTPVAPGLYPVRGLPWLADDIEQIATEPNVEPMSYLLRFQARSTYWRYFIVPQPQREELEGLEIAPTGGGIATFSGPERVPIANGTVAYRFISNEPLLLQSRSDYHFRLKGWARRAPNRDGVLVARLPVASSDQVIPSRCDPDRIYSDIYVYV